MGEARVVPAVGEGEARLAPTGATAGDTRFGYVASRRDRLRRATAAAPRAAAPTVPRPTVSATVRSGWPVPSPAGGTTRSGSGSARRSAAQSGGTPQPV